MYAQLIHSQKYTVHQTRCWIRMPNWSNQNRHCTTPQTSSYYIVTRYEIIYLFYQPVTKSTLQNTRVKQTQRANPLKYQSPVVIDRKQQHFFTYSTISIVLTLDRDCGFEFVCAERVWTVIRNDVWRVNMCNIFSVLLLWTPRQCRRYVILTTYCHQRIRTAMKVGRSLESLMMDRKWIGTSKSSSYRIEMRSSALVGRRRNTCEISIFRSLNFICCCCRLQRPKRRMISHSCDTCLLAICFVRRTKPK